MCQVDLILISWKSGENLTAWSREICVRNTLHFFTICLRFSIFRAECQNWIKTWKLNKYIWTIDVKIPVFCTYLILLAYYSIFQKGIPALFKKITLHLFTKSPWKSNTHRRCYGNVIFFIHLYIFTDLLNIVLLLLQFRCCCMTIHVQVVYRLCCLI